jgi:glycosyltransferase involved in cell wall biosynthesis
LQTKLRKSLSIIVPTYNEERNIRKTLANIVDAKLAAIHLSIIEIIVVDDGSTDRTLSIVEEFVSKCSERDSFTVIDCQKNFGVGHAFWVGLNKASNEFVTLVPGDGVFSTSSLRELFCNFSANGVTLTNRQNKYQRRPVRRLVSNLIGHWFSWVVGQRVHDPHSLFVFPRVSTINAYSEIWPSLSNDEAQRIGLEYHLKVLQYVLQTSSISQTIELEVITHLEHNSKSLSLKNLINFAYYYCKITFVRISDSHPWNKN